MLCAYTIFFSQCFLMLFFCVVFRFCHSELRSESHTAQCIFDSRVVAGFHARHRIVRNLTVLGRFVKRPYGRRERP